MDSRCSHDRPRSEQATGNRFAADARELLRLAYWDDRTLEELGPEERAELPEDFEEWPRTEKEIN